MKSIKEKLSLATCTLLAGGAHQAHAIDNAWDLDSSFLYYAEGDDRVQVAKAIAKLTGDVSDDDTATINLVLDTMSGSTPSGAVRSNSSAISFTSASGAGGITAEGTVPDIVEFSDTRLGFSLDWEHSVSRLRKMKYGGSLSVENDYQSYGASVALTQDTEDRSKTYSAGLAVSYDKIFRKTGGTPEPLTSTDSNSILSDGERYIYDAIIGMTKVLNKRTVGQLNFGITYSDGYHTDPYKVISVVDLVSQSDPSVGEFTYGEIDRLYEGRPTSRLRSVIYTALSHQYGEHNEVVHASYRYYQDDWGISAHTFDLTHRRPVGTSSFLEPHFRFYTQTAADFFMHHIDYSPTAPLPEYASADYRLDAIIGTTIGLNFGMDMGSSSKLRLRAEYINWQYEDAEYSENSAIVLQASYRKVF